MIVVINSIRMRLLKLGAYMRVEMVVHTVQAARVVLMEQVIIAIT